MIVLIDNYDSFTYNLARYFNEVRESVTVVKNDELSVEEINALAPSHLVISPGPCTPKESGISKEAILHFKGKIPILGVCLGHQTIGEVFGARVINAQVIKHGKTCLIETYEQTGLFRNIAKQFTVTRYHSLLLENASFSNSDLNITAVCKENNMDEVMAFEHSYLPIYGVQFHPESLLTDYGHDILQNFVAQSRKR